MPNGKAAGQRCVQLDHDNRCQLFGKAERPRVCVSFKASVEMCGDNYNQAIANLQLLELMTR